MDEILEAFPELGETAAAAVNYAFEKWLEAHGHERIDYECVWAARIGFAAGWIARPADYTG